MYSYLANRRKAIAWFFTGLIYLELIFTPVGAFAANKQIYPNNTLGKKGVVPKWDEFTGTHSNIKLRQSLHSPTDRKMAVVNQNIVTDGHQLTLPSPFVPATATDPDIGGPGQPEMTAFTSVNNSNLVDPFSGDFSYSIPLLDVGGYPLTLGYRAGVGMDDEAGWVGLGWNLNPGAITRNLRGLPDDFNGDQVKKVLNIRENTTVGVSAGADIEITGKPIKLNKALSDSTKFGIGRSYGVTYNNYRGWGLEKSLNATINAGQSGVGFATAGLSLNNSSMDGITIAPHIGFSGRLSKQEKENNGLGFTLSSPYNTKSGLKALQLSTGVSLQRDLQKNSVNANFNARTLLSFYAPTTIPSIQTPYTSDQTSFTAKVGLAKVTFHPNFSISGYRAVQFIAPEDTVQQLSSFGYLNYQEAGKNKRALLDFNREKELPYSEKPFYPHIALPYYSYDVFSMTGEGNGGMFRAYRGDIGYVYDHYMTTKDKSSRISVDIGVPELVHWGVDLNFNRSVSTSKAWTTGNPLSSVLDFRKDSGLFQAAYFRNPAEKSINSKQFYETIGGDELVNVALHKELFKATNYLNQYQSQLIKDSSQLNTLNAVKPTRDKRTQVITYLNAKDAETGALAKYIENFTPNVFEATTCQNEFPETQGHGIGVIRTFYENPHGNGAPVNTDSFNTDIGLLYSNNANKFENDPQSYAWDNFSYRWRGRLKAPKSGTYTFNCLQEDAICFKINGKVILYHDGEYNIAYSHFENSVNLVEGQFYDIEILMASFGGEQYLEFWWKQPGATILTKIEKAYLFNPSVDSFAYKQKADPSLDLLVKEKRTSAIRKAHHISEVNVLNADGRRYIYGIPVYNLVQKEYSFAVDGRKHGNSSSGLVKYQHGVDNTTQNRQGTNWYFSKDEMPAYAHSFLLTGILSSDYSDITGNGITDDDIGEAVKFNYSRICDTRNPFKWRAPAVENDSASFNEGLLTDYRDDKGSYLYGEKELWYMHSIESKTMIATFVLENRHDIYSRDENGRKISNTSAKRLKEINLYNKSEFAVLGTKSKPVKTVHFEYSYELCKGVNGTDTGVFAGKLTLKKVSFTYNGVKKQINAQNPYKFYYSSHNPGYNLKSYDRWGNFKNPEQNPGSKPGNIISNIEYPYALQDSAMAAKNAAAWNLDSISLPSGGTMKVEYEADDYAWVQNKRAMQLFKILGFSNNTTGAPNNAGRLYEYLPGMLDDHLIVYIKVPRTVSSKADVYNFYLSQIKKLYFRLSVEMPVDNYSNGKRYEYIPCYAEIDQADGYGFTSPDVIWVRLKGINAKGDGDGEVSPLVKAALQYIRLNHPSKAYPGSETGNAVDVKEAVNMVLSMATEISSLFITYDEKARLRDYGKFLDSSRSYIRLNNPWLKKFGGGHRVKRITIYDNWDKMTNQRPARYGQEYSYTDSMEVGGKKMLASSGVAIYEPAIGGEENPFRQPIEYIEKVAALAPVTMGYSEEPLGESLFPSPGVGYSCVRTRTINYKNKKSANGFTETRFYTAFDFPVFTDRTLLGGENKIRKKSPLGKFLKVNATHFLAMTQGFRIELNDMHGKLRSESVYGEASLKAQNYVARKEYIYRSKQRNSGEYQLENTVSAIGPDGYIDTAAFIGKDVELMLDMRDHQAEVSGFNVSPNSDMFAAPGVPPIWVIPMILDLMQSELTINRSIAATKVVQRYGVLKKVTVYDKGSKVTTENLLYDSETGDVLLTRTQNEFNDSLYNLTYPSHWAYDGMGLAYKNIDLKADHLTFRNGKIENATPAINQWFTSGDELLVYGKEKTGGTICNEEIATFPNSNKIWCIDSSLLRGGPSVLFFIDRNGSPYSGLDVSVRIIRSGRRNIFGAVGDVTCMVNPIRKNKNTGAYELIIDDSSKVLSATGNEFRQLWKVEDVFAKRRMIDCLPHYEATGKLRCVQMNGQNTGEQEAEEMDVNIYSGEHLNTRWVSIGQNCQECPVNEVWYATGAIRCVPDASGNYNGTYEREERDTTSCGSFRPRTRWVLSGQSCSICPSKNPVWKRTGLSRCAKDGYGNNTGFLELEERDSSACSANATRWVQGPEQCATCKTPPVWNAVGSPECKTGDCNMQYGSLLVEDINPCSDSFGLRKEIRVSMNCAPACDSLTTLVSNFKALRQASYGLTILANTQEVEFYPYRDITRNGAAMLPDFVRYRPGTSHNGISALFKNGRAFCTPRGFSVEARFKISRDTLYGDVFYIGINGGGVQFERYNINFPFVDTILPAGLYLSGAGGVGDGVGFGYESQSNEFGLLRADPNPNVLLDWCTAKYTVTPSKYYIYFNDKLITVLPRDSTKPIPNCNGVGFTARGRQGMVDWFKIRDADDKLVYWEDFNDPFEQALPDAGAVCAPPPDCETAFAQYFNQQKGTNYSYRQIDSIYYKNCNTGLNACGNKDSILHLFDNYRKLRQTSYGVTTSYKVNEDKVISDFSHLANQGILRLPDSIRNKPDTLYHPVNIKLNNGVFCWENGYAIEARVKFLAMPSDGTFLKLLGRNLNLDYVKSANNSFIQNISDNHGMDRYFGNRPGLLDSMDLLNGFLVKVVITPSHYYVYVNAQLIWDTVRNPSLPISNFADFEFQPKGRNFAIDFIKLYDAPGHLKYFEDYLKPALPSLPERTYNCPTASPDCEQEFADYYNLKMGTSFNFHEIDSIYFRYTCRHLDVCGMNELIVATAQQFNSIAARISLNDPNQVLRRNSYFDRLNRKYAMIDSIKKSLTNE